MHKHAKIIMEFAVEAQTNPEPLSAFYCKAIDDDIASDEPLTDSDMTSIISGSFRSDIWEIRRKPRTIKIGDIDVPEPVRTAPDHEFYYPVLSNASLFNNEIWLGGAQDIAKLERGLIHLDKESAITHAKALLSLTQKKE